MTSDIKEKIKMSKIEQLIGEIEEFIDGCKLQPFSSTNALILPPYWATSFTMLELRYAYSRLVVKKIVSTSGATFRFVCDI